MLRKNRSHGYTNEELFEIGFWSAAIFMAHDEQFHSHYTWDDINADDRAEMRDQLVSMYESMGQIVKSADWEQMGIDLYFCLVGAGVDFRDRDNLTKNQKNKLVELSKTFKNECKEIYEDEETNELRYG